MNVVIIKSEIDGGFGMDILIYGNAREKELLIQHMKSEACMAFRLVKYSHAEDYDAYLKLLRLNSYDLIFVMADNAAGMEGVIAAQNVQPESQIIWFSNDKNFVAQSYRLGVAYFAVKPIDEKTVSLATKRCQQKEELIYE